MDKSDCLIYGYLAILAVLSIIYGFYVVLESDTHGPGLQVNVVLPLDAVYAVNNASSDLISQIYQLNNVTKSFSVSVWWGLVETIPGSYDWTAYSILFSQIIAAVPGAKIKADISFHACNSNTFCDSANEIDLPQWIVDLGNTNPDIYYTDVNGNSSREYLTSGVDYQPIFAPSNRTAVQVYSSFIQSFLNTFNGLLDSNIIEIQIGLGPEGEFKYPAFPVGRWAAPGIGQFQNYDNYLQNEYKIYASKSGHPEWAYLPGDDVLQYNNAPKQSSFFSGSGKNSSSSDYGVFFLNWYTNRLLQHGNAILSQASSMLSAFSPNVTLSTRIGCVYWQSADVTHAAEFTAGYQNYSTIAQMLANYDATLEIGCFDLTDKDIQKELSKSASPQSLVKEVFTAAQSVGAKMEGTNTRIDYSSNYDRIETNCRKDISTVTGFNFRYLSQDLLDNLRQFRDFYDDMTHPDKLK